MIDAVRAPSGLILTVATAVVLLVSSTIGLVAWPTIYGAETELLVDAAAAQDVASIAIAVILIVVAVVATRNASLLARLAWCGLLAFVAYNAAIYCFSVHFGALFLAWTAVLGLSVFGLVATVAGVDRSALRPLVGTAAATVLAWVLIAATAVFVVLWLSEIVPDLLAGRPSTSATQWQVPTNPVHVLDLALFLPAAAVGGVLLLRREPLGFLVGGPVLVWLILTCVPILLTPVMAAVRGHEPAWGAVPPVAVLLVVFLVSGGLLLKEGARRRPATR